MKPVRIYNLILAFLFLNLGWTPILSQQHIFDNQLITADNGLSNLMTIGVYKDRQGFLWAGTPYGLDRYDGHNFKHYTYEKNGLLSSTIHGIREDEEGNLWLFHSNSLSSFPIDNYVYVIDVFNVKTEKAIPLEEYLNKQAPFKTTEINCPKVIDSKKRLWITTAKGELFLNEKGQFKKIFEQKNAIFNCLTLDKQDDIWLGWDEKIICINHTGKILESFTLPHRILGIWTGADKTVWLAGEKLYDGLDKNISEISIWSKTKEDTQFKPFVFHKKENLFELKFSNDQEHYVYRDQQGFWYFSFDGQTNLFDRQGNWIHKFSTLLNKNFGFIVLNSFEEEGGVWWGSPTGLLKTSVKENPFQLIHHQEKTYSNCRGITEDENGNIYFLNNAIFQWNPQNHKLKSLTESTSAYALAYTNHAIWAATNHGDNLGFEINLKTEKRKEYRALNAGTAFDLLKSNEEGKFLAGTNNGLEYIDINSQNILSFEKYKPNSTSDSTLKSSSVFHLHKNPQGIWLATENGVFLINENQGILRHFQAPEDLPFNHIRHIHEDKEGVFWLATKGGGVIRWEPPISTQKVYSKNSHKPYRQFTTKNVLSNDYTYAIYEDDYDNLWIPSDKGLMRMDKKTEQVKTYTTEDGLPHNEFNLTSHYKAKDGTLYFGGLGGLISFHPKVFANESANQTPLAFTGYYLLEEDAEEMTDKTDLLRASDKIVIEPTDKLFELSFALLDYDDWERHRYAYKIEGYANNWNYTNENHVQITNLPYGKYNLKVKGQNGSDGWSEKELSLGIHVLKPFYLQWWFITLFVLFVVFIIWWRIRQLEKDKEHLELEVKKRTQKIEEDKQTIAIQAEELRELDKTKTRFFSNITHEFRTPLTLVIGPVEQLLSAAATLPAQKKLSGILKNAQNLLGLINQLLDISKLESGQMKVEIAHGDIMGYTQELVNRFEALAKTKQLSLTFTSDTKKWETHFDKNKWGKICNNLLSNAIKFTPNKGPITIKIQQVQTLEQSYIQLEVKDSGTGIKPENMGQIFNRFYQTDASSAWVQEGTGIGLALVKELVEFQKGTISVESVLEKGTTFIVKLPVIIPAQSSPLMPPQSIFLPLFPKEHVQIETKKNDSLKGEKLSLLIIEDNSEMRDYISSCLDNSIYEVFEAADGDAGIAKALEIVPDLIISDVMMPKKNGFEVTHAIRNHLPTSHIPLILLTAKASLENRLEGLERGADAYLTKPFKPQELVVRIKKLIELRQSLQVRYQYQNGEPLKTDLVFQKEDHFVSELKEYIMLNLAEANLSAEAISQHFAMSRMQLHRKLKSLTNTAVSDYVRMIRLNEALLLLKQQELNISEIAYRTGFSSPSSFTRTFKKHYGKAPSEI